MPRNPPEPLPSSLSTLRSNRGTGIAKVGYPDKSLSLAACCFPRGYARPSHRPREIHSSPITSAARARLSLPPPPLLLPSHLFTSHRSPHPVYLLFTLILSSRFPIPALSLLSAVACALSGKAFVIPPACIRKPIPIPEPRAGSRNGVVAVGVCPSSSAGWPQQCVPARPPHVVPDLAAKAGLRNEAHLRAPDEVRRS